MRTEPKTGSLLATSRPPLSRVSEAAARAPKAYPGPVGELVARELSSWEEMKGRFGGYELVGRLVDDVLNSKRSRISPGGCRYPGRSYGPPGTFMDHHELMRLRDAAFKAMHTHPGPVGELVSREILTWEELGCRLAPSGLVSRLVDALLTAR